MAGIDILALERSNLNAFLFAEVGTESNGMRLSVLSTLARFDLDPWREAGRLNGLSRSGAIEALAYLIETMPSGGWLRSEAVPIATRLVCLLPQRSGAFDPTSRPFTFGPAKPNRDVGASEASAVRAGSQTGLSNRQLVLLVLVLSSLLAGLGASAFYRSTIRTAISGAASAAMPPTADHLSPGSIKSPDRTRFKNEQTNGIPAMPSF
jgi:hypothetical protein